MYRIPGDLNLNDIVGSEILQIGLGRYIVQFNFGSGRVIGAEGGIEVFEQNQLIAEWDAEHQWSSAAFQRLLMAPVLSYAVLNDRLLEIKFEGELALRLHDDSYQYERIHFEPEGIVV